MTPEGGDAAERSPFERAVDLLVYAPLGLAFTAREELPRLIAKGRSGATGQVGVARVVGKFAVHQGQREAGKLLRQATERLAAMGFGPDAAARPGPAGPAGGGAAGAASGGQAGPGPAAAARPAGSAERKAPAGTGRDRPAAGALAIPGYDSLSAPQVVQRLDGLSGAELEAVRAYEAATRGRKTILSRVGQLQSAQ